MCTSFRVLSIQTFYEILFCSYRFLCQFRLRNTLTHLSIQEYMLDVQVHNLLQQRFVDLQHSHRELLREHGVKACQLEEQVKVAEGVSHWMAKFLEARNLSVKLGEENRWLKEQLQGANMDAVLEKMEGELVELKMKEQEAVRRAEIAERDKERAEKSRRDVLVSADYQFLVALSMQRTSHNYSQIEPQRDNNGTMFFLDHQTCLSNVH